MESMPLDLFKPAKTYQSASSASSIATISATLRYVEHLQLAELRQAGPPVPLESKCYPSWRTGFEKEP
jgi:hypothetical protein